MNCSSKHYLTIDTCVISRATMSTGEGKKYKKLLKIVYDQHGIVLDKPDNKILKEYRYRVKGYAKEWLITILSRKKKVCKVVTKGFILPRSLRKDRFDSKFIIASLLSKDKILISDDHGFFKPSVETFIKQSGIKLFDTNNALDNFDS